MSPGSRARTDPLVDWFVRELDRLGVTVTLGVTWRATATRTAGARSSCSAPVRSPGPHPYDVEDGAHVLDIADVRAGADRRARPRARSSSSTRSAARSVWRSPRSWERGRCSSRRTTSPATSSPAPATSLRPTPGSPRPASRSNAGRCSAPCAPEPSRWRIATQDSAGRSSASPSSTAASACRPTRSPTWPIQVGDAVAPRTVHEAVLEGRRAAASI